MTTGVAVVAILLLLVAALYLSRYLLKRAVREVVALLRAKGATDPESAAMLEELGLERGGTFDRMFRLRDYRPSALRLLAQANVVRATDGGRIYLSEAQLAGSHVARFAGLE